MRRRPISSISTTGATQRIRTKVSKASVSLCCCFADHQALGSITAALALTDEVGNGKGGREEESTCADGTSPANWFLLLAITCKKMPFDKRSGCRFVCTSNPDVAISFGTHSTTALE